MVNRLKQTTQHNIYLIFTYFAFGTFVFFKLIFVFYGYIATEEGTSIYNQKLAYSGRLPFVNYDAWNSFINDYLVGWYQLIIKPSILNQRLFGLILSCAIFLLTLKLSRIFKSNRLTCITAILLTFGSYSFVYLGTVPFSDQTMSLFILFGLLLLSKNFLSRNLSAVWGFAGLALMTIAVFIRIQAIPMTLIAVLFFAWINRKSLRKIGLSFLIVFGISLLISLPFATGSLANFSYALTWPMQADKILIYQKYTSAVTFPMLTTFIQDAIRDYGIFLLVIPAAVIAYRSNFLKISSSKDKLFPSLLVLIAGSFLITGLIHKPPYASYLNSGVPVFSLLAAYALEVFISNLNKKRDKKFFYLISTIFLINNFFQYPHFKYIKTAKDTLANTPHAYLDRISSSIAAATNPGDEVLSFYTPITVTAGRIIPDNLNRDRFSLTFLPTPEALKFHLTNSEMLINYINSRRAKIIAFSNDYTDYFGATESERTSILSAIEKNYTKLMDSDTMKYMESPKAKPLHVFVLRTF